MKVLTEGHLYRISTSNPSRTYLIPFTDTEELGVHNTQEGITTEQLLEVLIDRVSYVQSKLPCKENACCITHMQEALMWLERKTAQRLKSQEAIRQAALMAPIDHTYHQKK